MHRKLLRALFIISIPYMLQGCSTTPTPDAYGYFEAKEWLVSAPGNGKITAIYINEGQEAEQGKPALQIDTLHLQFQLRQVDAQIQAFTNTLRDAAMISIESAAIPAQIASLRVQREGILTLQKEYTIRNPEAGTILEIFSGLHEYAAQGTPLYKIANLRDMLMSAWFPASLLTELHLGDSVRVIPGTGTSQPRAISGVVSRISSSPEYAPGHVQSRDNWPQMLYEVTISVLNDGSIKPGMPGEVFLDKR